ncbi:MAG: hypothetical protein IPL42_07775 [Saprospiraceae bacterium]|nr:hypothetical protein [Saprospiraceae bacterium]
MNTFKTQFQFIAASFIFWISACVVDPVDPNGNFTGPSEITIVITSGTFSGKTYNLISNSSGDDHNFIISNSINKILCEPIQIIDSNNLSEESFINWAWVSDSIKGTYDAIFATDPSVYKSGDIQLHFRNLDELNTYIPKGTQIIIEEFGGLTGAIIGQFGFSAPLDYRLNGINRRENASFEIHFKIKRGENI